MKITERMELGGICIGSDAQTREEAFQQLIELQQKCGNTERPRHLKQELYYAEEQGKFTIGGGVALCRLKTNSAKRPLLSVLISAEGVALDAPDGALCRLLVLSVLPESAGEDPIDRLQALLLHAEFREQLMAATDAPTFLALLQMAEEGRYAAPAEPDADAPLILCILPDRENGAAAAALQLAAGRLGMILETEGEGKRHFLPDRIEEADGILLLGDGLKGRRFNGKPLLVAAVNEAEHRPEYILKQVLRAPIYYKKEAALEERGLLRLFHNSRLLPPLLLSSGAAILIGRLMMLLKAPDGLSAAAEMVGLAALSTVIPLIAGQLGFYYARWSGMAVGICAGVVLSRGSGGVWLALAFGLASGLLMRGIQRRISRLGRFRSLAEWSAPVAGVLLLGGLAAASFKLTDWSAQGIAFLTERISFPWLRGLIMGLPAALDPGGPLYRGAALVGQGEEGLRFALGAAGLAVAGGISLFSLLWRRGEPSRLCGIAAFPAGLAGSAVSVVPFAVNAPLRTCLAALPGAALAGVAAISLHHYLWGGLLGAPLVAAALFALFHRDFKGSHKVKKSL